MKIEKFEDVLAWQKAQELVLLNYSSFKNLKDFSFKDQLLRASVSIMNNIAEGFERKTDKDFKHFLYIAKGSCGEYRSMLYLALKLKYIPENTFTDFKIRSLEISRMLGSFIRYLGKET
jgi:four helix bundle protein